MKIQEQPDLTAALERIEANLDAILKKLKWAPGDAADWYKEITQGCGADVKTETNK